MRKRLLPAGMSLPRTPAEARTFAGRARRGIRRRIYRPAPPLQTPIAKTRLDRAVAGATVPDDAALLAGALADGDRGTVAFAVTAGGPSAPDVGAATGLARRLHDHGFGVVVLPPDRWTHLPARTRAVIATTQTFDPGLVPDDVAAVAWMIHEPQAWPRHSALTLFDAYLPGSAALARLLLARPDVRAASEGAWGDRPLPLVEVLPLAADVPPGHPLGGTGHHTGVTVVPRGNASGIALPLRRATRHGPVRILAEPRTLAPKLRRLAVGARGPSGRQAAFGLAKVAVVDDPVQAHASVVPAGVFEALANGAVPVTASRLGLADLGLGAVPTFRSGKELGRRLDALLRLRSVPPELAALPARVLAEHTYAARARTVTCVLDRLDGHARPERRLGFFPDFRVTNPYQDMLYAALAERGARIGPVRRPAERLVLRDSGGSLAGYTLHVHWTAAVVQVATDEADARARLDAFRRRVADVRARGGHLVWTVHNVVSHDARFRDVEAELCRFLAAEADLVHVMCADTFAATQPDYTIDPARAVVVPHSSYLGVYPDIVTRTEARRRLGVGPDDVALLALGGIRPYRGLGSLVDVLDALLPETPALRLLVAGKPGDAPGTADLRERCERHPRVVSSFAHVPDAELQVWARAADVAVLPYRAILNSGAFKLAQTFGLPVVAPRDGCVASAIDPASAIGFDPADPADLRRAVAAAVRLARDPQSAAAATVAARQAAAGYPPARMAADFADALDALDAGPTAARETGGTTGNGTTGSGRSGAAGRTAPAGSAADPREAARGAA